MIDALVQFTERAQSRGLIPPNGGFVGDGRMRRCDVEAPGGTGKQDGAYVLHLDDFPAGGFENHRDGLGWESWSVRRDKPMTSAERMAYQIKLDEQRRAREADEARRRAEQRANIEQARKTSPYATDAHPYAVKKGIKVEGRKIREYRGPLEVSGLKCDGALMIPLFFHSTPDAEPELGAVQFIGPDGEKRFYGPVGGCYFPVGKIDPKGKLLICEGAATALSLHEATNLPVLAAMTCGNLARVAVLMRQRHGSELELVICADDDRKREAA